MKYLVYTFLFVLTVSCSEGETGKEQNPSTEKKEAKETERVEQGGFQPIKGTEVFQSIDGLNVTVDIYEIDSISPWLILCHQARFSRGEYAETAPRLNELGYNCIAIDQRSGGSAKNIVNETAKRAKEKGMGTDYLDAEKDIVSAIQFVDILKEGRDQKIILVGSSYSASLVLKIAAMEGVAVNGVAAFSPGEYFEGMNLAEKLSKIDVPTFVTSARNEKDQTMEVTSQIPEEHLTVFIPREKGVHGSRALWDETPNHEEYRVAFHEFLDRFKD